MTKLNQIIALEKGTKTRAETAFTAVYRVAGKGDLFNGFFKTYDPFEDEGVRYPSEALKVQATAEGVITDVTEALVSLFNIVATKDEANRHAAADIVVNGAVLVPQVPVTTLLWVEKKLVDIRTFVAALPVLDPVETWSWDAANERFVAEVKETIRQKKVKKYQTIAPATDKHAAQVVADVEDVPEGRWSLVKVSTALPATRRAELLARVDALSAAVKMAREEANSIQVTDVHIGERITGYLFR